METMQATKILVFSGGLAIFSSSLLGFLMLLPMQSWGKGMLKDRKISMKFIGAAHLDWIVLSMMQGLAAGLLAVFSIEPPAFAVWLLVAGGWLNPLPYVFRAFGINAFALTGPPLQRAAATLGLLSSVAIVTGWAVLLWQAWQVF